MDPLIALALGGMALSAIGNIANGYMGSSLASLQSSIASANASFLKQQAGMEEEEGQASLAQGRLQQSRTIAQVNTVLGGQTGKFAASNLDPTYGSPLLLEGYTAGQGATDVALEGAKASMGLAGASMQAAGTLAQAATAQGQASAYSMQSTQDILSGYLGAATTGLQGGSNVMMSNMMMNMYGSNMDAAMMGMMMGV